MTYIQRVIRISNTYYNQGLQQAQKRDLSSAVISLERSLKFYKMNVQARNLLGLIYFEMGETVDAIREWVISQNLVPENNMAEKYLKEVQSNSNRLDALNQTIKKYNQVLEYCKQGNKDVAVIQLKKLLSMNTKFLKGHQLLALLYLEQGRYDLAKKSLGLAIKIDQGNKLTLRYLKEVNQYLQKNNSERSMKSEKGKLGKKKGVLEYQVGNDTIITPTSFKEHSVVGTILNILLGGVIGVLITWFLIVPSIRQSAMLEANQAIRQASETIATKNQNISSLEHQLEEMQIKMDKMQDRQDSSDEVVDVFNQLLQVYHFFHKEEVEQAFQALETLDASLLTGEASQIYQEISQEIHETYIDVIYQEGKRAYDGQQYETAISKLKIVAEIEEEYEDGYAVYYLAQCYSKLQQVQEAVQCYEKVLELNPGTERGRNAQNYIENHEDEIIAENMREELP